MIETPFSRREALALVLVIVGILATRLPFIMHGLDEWDTVNFALSVVRFDVLNHQPHPPGQFFYVRLMQLINGLTGDELFTLSFASALGGSLALVPYYFAVRQIFGPAVGFGAVVLTAFTPGFWIASLRMISDPVAILFVYGAVCALLAGLTNRHWFLFGMALCGIALGVKQTAVYFMAPFAIVVNGVILSRAGMRQVLLGSGLFAMAVAAWLLPTVGNCHGWANYIGACRAMQFDNYAHESIIFRLSPSALWSQWQHNLLEPWAGNALAATMLILAAVGMVLCLWRGLRGLLFAVFAATVAFYTYFFLYRFNKYYVYYVPLYGAFAAAALFVGGAAMARWTSWLSLRLWVPGIAVAIVTAVNFGFTLPLLPKIAHFRAPPQAALEALHKTFGAGSEPPLWTDDRTTQHELLYFHLRRRVDLLNLHPDLRAAVAALNSARKVYVLSPLSFRVEGDQLEAIHPLGHYVWKNELYDALQGRSDLRQLSLYEVSAPLPAAYEFKGAESHPPLLQNGMWEDGWCGADSRFLLPCDGATASLVHLRFTAPESFGYRYPLRLICEFGDGRRTELTVERPGRANFVMTLPPQPGARVIEVRVRVPQTYRPSQQDPFSTDDRDLSVHLDALGCVTESAPVLVQREDGWYESEDDGKTSSRWTNGNATLSVLMDRPRTLVVESSVLSFSNDNSVEVFVDGHPAQMTSLLGTGWNVVKWRLPLEQGLHHVTLHSLNPGSRPPGDDRILAFRVRDFQTRLEL